MIYQRRLHNGYGTRGAVPGESNTPEKMGARESRRMMRFRAAAKGAERVLDESGAEEEKKKAVATENPAGKSRWKRIGLVLAAGVIAGCMDAAPPAEDVDGGDVQEDVEAAEVVDDSGLDETDAEVEAEDVAGPDADSDVVEGEDTEADAEVDEDADSGDVEASEEVSDGDVAEDGDAAEALDCTLSDTWTEAETFTATDAICDGPYGLGSTQEVVKIWEVQHWAGPDCTEPETRTLYSYEIIFTPPISNSNLDCMHGDVLAMPNGDEGIVSSETGGLVTAPAIGEATLPLMGPVHDWGATEYKTRLTSIVASDTVTLSTYNGEMTLVGAVRTTIRDHAPIPSGTGTDERGYIAKNVDSFGETVEVVYVELQPAPPVLIERVEGSIVVFEGRNYVLHLETGTGEHRGLTLIRE